MKRFALLGASVLLFAACSTPTTVIYTLQFDTQNNDRQADLTLASMNVIKRRVEAHGSEPLDINLNKVENTVSLTVKYDNKELAEALSQELTAPFVLDFMVQSAEGEPVDATVEKHGDFHKVDFDGNHVDWILPREDPNDALHGSLLIGFTEAGATRMHEVFSTYSGRAIGLFVRGQLAAKLMIDENIPKNAILISGLPNKELSEIFADDVNVGLHVTFVPAQ